MNMPCNNFYCGRLADSLSLVIDRVVRCITRINSLVVEIVPPRTANVRSDSFMNAIYLYFMLFCSVAKDIKSIKIFNWYRT